MFDGVGHGVYGRLAQKMFVRYSGRRPADDTILDLVSEATMQGGGPAAADRVLVVTNDRELRDRLAAKGARTAPLQWLIGKLNVPAPPAATGSRRPGIGAGRPPATGADGGNAAGRRGSQGLEARPRRDHQDRDAEQGRPPQAPPARSGLSPRAAPAGGRPAASPAGSRPRTCAGVTPPVSICA